MVLTILNNYYTGVAMTIILRIHKYDIAAMTLPYIDPQHYLLEINLGIGTNRNITEQLAHQM